MSICCGLILKNRINQQSHISGDFLELFTEETTKKLRTILHEMQEKYLKKLSKRYQRKIIISLDSSIYAIHSNPPRTTCNPYIFILLNP